MDRLPHDEEREERIHNEIVVDAYGPEEQAIGWYYYLDQTLSFPFRARCIAERLTSPLRIGAKTEVIAMAPVEECDHEMFVLIRRDGRDLAIPLAQVESVAVDEETHQAIADWHYWVGRGYQL